MLGGLWKRLVGGSGSGGTAAEPPGEAVEYNGYRIRAVPYLADGQYQTAGTIEKDFPSGVKQHRFVRADRHVGKDAAVDFSIAKARQIIDQQGDRMFDAG